MLEKQQHHISFVLFILFIIVNGLLPHNEESTSLLNISSYTFLAQPSVEDDASYTLTIQGFHQQDSTPDKSENKLKKRCKGSEVYFNPLQQLNCNKEVVFLLRPFHTFSRDPASQGSFAVSLLRGPPAFIFG